MSIFNTKYEIRDTRYEKGVVLLFTLIVMITLISVVGAYLSLVQYSTISTGAQISDSQAIYLAEAGLHKAIWYLTNTAPDDSIYGSWRTTAAYPAEPGPGDTDPQQESLGGGTYTIWVENSAGDVQVYARGTVGGLSRVMTQTLVLTLSHLERAIHGDGNNDVNFERSAGIITGNVSCVRNVKPNSLPVSLTVTGTVTDKDSDPAEPTIKASIPLGAGTTYYNLANDPGNPGQLDMNNDIKFTAAGTYTGTWYSGKKIKIEASNVTINGVLVAEGTIEFKKGVTNIIINPKAYYTTQNYPALIAGDKIDAKVDKKQGGLKDSTITGLVYAEGDIKFNNTTNITFNGTIVGLKKIELKDGTNVIVTYDAGIFTPEIPGFNYKITVTPQNDWNEI